MKTIKVAGVPEHFNLPWHISIDNGDFEKAGIDVQWTDIPEGTGKMCQLLREGTTDIAIVLTEGIVKDIVAGNPSSIVQVYVESPLIWGIHVSENSKHTRLSDLEEGKVAISRYGSGSHLMAYVNAQQENWNTDALQFEIVNTIDGAVEALNNGKADYFMWERFMTQPLVDQDPSTVAQLLKIINQTTLGFKEIPAIDEKLATKFHQKLEDIQAWLALTVWSQNPLPETVLNKIQNQLFDLKIIDKKGTFAEIVKAI
jgi:NMT1/THI5 like